MAIPLSFLRASLAPTSSHSLGDSFASQLTKSGKINSLLDCICSTSKPVIHSPDASRPPLRHEDLHSFISTFSLPHSQGERLGQSDRVMLVLPTGPENAVALLALASYHTCAPVNSSCTASELSDDARRLNAKAVLTTKDLEDRLELRRLSRELGCEIIYIEPRTSGPTGLFDFSLIDNVSALPPRPTPLNRLAHQSLVLHTSGTSGTKKVVPYRLISLIVGTASVVHSWDLQPSDVNINMMPLFHVGGIVRNLLAPVMSGGSAVMCSGFDSIAFWNLSAKFKATWYYAAPTIHHAILASRLDSGVSLQDIHIRMICNAAGGLVPSLASRMKDTFSGAVILPSYGMTECMPVASPPTDYQLDRPGSSGIARGPHLSIRDPADINRQLSCGETGAICVRGIPTFEGYEVSPDVSIPLDKSGFSREGWFDSGDVGYMDADGYLYITGRSKEIINKGGEVISPFEVEEAIMVGAKDCVKSTLVFAIEHDVLQECIGVVIVPVPTHPRISLVQLQDRLRDHLHPSKWPFAIVYMDDLPMNSAGKLLRINLASRLGMDCLSDMTPILSRHFEAEAPSTLGSLTDPIPCSRVPINLHDVDRVLATIPSIKDIALRFARDQSIEAFLCVDPESQLEGEDVKMALSQVLPGYSVPGALHILKGVPLIRNEGRVNFEVLENHVANTRASTSMTELELLVCDIFASLLPGDVKQFNPDSDFFLLGGNSLLLGKLSYHIRKQSGASIAIATLFNRSTIKEIATLIEEEVDLTPTSTIYGDDLLEGCDSDSHIQDFEPSASRDQTTPLNLIVQALPIVFYPLKAALTWSLLLFFLSLLVQVVDKNYWQRLAALLMALAAARLCVAILCPLAAIGFKWIVIGTYKKGTYRMWSVYYLRWWIVDQSLRSAGKGIFSAHPSFEILYYRMLGARIGKNVRIDPGAILGEFDLLIFQDECRIDAAQIRGFCVERNGFFRLNHVKLGCKVVVNTHTVVSPGAVIADGLVYGPHASSNDGPSPSSYAAYNRTLMPEPKWYLITFVAWPIISVVWIISHLPWFAAIALIMNQTSFAAHDLEALESIISHLASPRRIAFHMLSVVARAILTPVLQLVFGIAVKRSLGLNDASAATNSAQLPILRRYINSILLSQQALHRAFIILGAHYEIISIMYRAMGAKIGRRIYWPGSGLYCPDPELLEVGDDVVFGAYVELFTVDQIGSGIISIGDGAMVADRVVLSPGTTIGRRTVMGSGALGKRNTTYEDGSTWIGNDNGGAICLSKGSRAAAESQESTMTPFGRAFYENGANYPVIPYVGVLMTNLAIIALAALYWAIGPVFTIQLLQQLQTHFRHLNIFGPHWYRFIILYACVAVSFIITLNILALGSMLILISTKWAIIGQRDEGSYDWDKSSYNQRWQVHLILHAFLFVGYGEGGVLAPLSGSAYIIWYLCALGAKIGRNCFAYTGHKIGFMTEPDLIELGDNVNLDDCSVVAHINSRGNFSLNRLKVANGCAMRAGSRLLSGASMEDNSLLCEHSLLTSGEVAESNAVYAGWPAIQAKNFGLSRA